LSPAKASLGRTSYPNVNTDPTKNNKVAFRQDAIEFAKAYPKLASGV
jgi:hypothetical protein